MSAKPFKYLIVGPSWVGDMVMAQSLCIHLKAHHASTQIDMLAPLWTAALTDRMPEVNRLVASDFQHGKLGLASRWRLGRALREENYTNAIVLPNSLKAALVPAIAGIPIRTGFIGEQRWGLLNDIRKLNKTSLPMTVQRFLALGNAKTAEPVLPEEIPVPALAVDPAEAAELALTFHLTLDKPVLVLCPGAEFGPSKQWPAIHYGAVAQHYLSKGWQVWLVGSEKDLSVCQQINVLSNQQATVLAGKTSLPQAVDLMSLADLVVANDSGLMHIAAGLNKPLVAVYGSTDPGHTPPLSGNHKVARLALDCMPCFQRECPLQHHNCMQQLGPNRVIELADKLLA